MKKMSSNTAEDLNKIALDRTTSFMLYWENINRGKIGKTTKQHCIII